MNIETRLRKLEAVTPSPEPLEVRVRRPICKPGPDGPEYVGRTWVAEHRNGLLVKTQKIHEDPGLDSGWHEPTPAELDAIRAKLAQVYRVSGAVELSSGSQRG